MRQTWRWFGPPDRASVDDILQAGAEGVVTALHHIPPGVAWSAEDIGKRQAEVARRRDGTLAGLAWEVVESLPVSEDIKRQTGDWRAHVAAWQESLRNLAASGIEVVCYNFMPVLDWTRTDLHWSLPTGATCMRFDLIDFAAFDIHILARPGAVEDFPEAVAEEAARRHAGMGASRREEIARTVLFGLPGETEQVTPETVHAHLVRYAEIDSERLRRNFIDFLEQVAPLAQELGLRLCCHPDDPPFPLLGLPRIMSTEADYAAILQAVDLRANGITLCAGSLGARPDNDLPGMMRRLGDRVHFLHLRNVARESSDVRGSFHETSHLNGDIDMVALVSEALAEEARRTTAGRADACIPFRPDHGQDIVDDHERHAQPGYPTIGRLKGLAEIRGIMHALAQTKSR